MSFTLQLDNGQHITVRLANRKDEGQYLACMEPGKEYLTKYGVTLGQTDESKAWAKAHGFGSAAKPPKVAKLYQDGNLVGQLTLVKGETTSGNAKVWSDDASIPVSVNGEDQFLRVQVSYPPTGTINTIVRSARGRKAAASPVKAAPRTVTL